MGSSKTHSLKNVGGGQYGLLHCYVICSVPRGLHSSLKRDIDLYSKIIVLSSIFKQTQGWAKMEYKDRDKENSTSQLHVYGKIT